VCLIKDRIQNLVRGQAKDGSERKGRDGCVGLLGRSERGRPEAKDTLTMISRGVEISIAGGGADEKDGHEKRGFFSLFLCFFCFYIIYSLVRCKKAHGALAMAKTKRKIQNLQTTGTSGTSSLGLRSMPVPGPHNCTKFNQVI